MDYTPTKMGSIENTKKFNQLLKALDTGKRVYCISNKNTYPLEAFKLMMDDNDVKYIALFIDIQNFCREFDVYPSLTADEDKLYNTYNIYFQGGLV